MRSYTDKFHWGSFLSSESHVVQCCFTWHSHHEISKACKCLWSIKPFHPNRLWPLSQRRCHSRPVSTTDRRAEETAGGQNVVTALTDIRIHLDTLACGEQGVFNVSVFTGESESVMKGKSNKEMLEKMISKLNILHMLVSCGVSLWRRVLWFF